eukprot:m51a1_g14760 putative inositol hexakisphosphate kinase 3 (308) ;mRNA; f:342281-343608
MHPHTAAAVTKTGPAGLLVDLPPRKMSMPSLSSPPPPRPFAFQVGGHAALIEHNGTVLKPLCEPEALFYERLGSQLPGLLEFVPVYRGRREIAPKSIARAEQPTLRYSRQQEEQGDPEEKKAYLALEDLTRVYARPSITDLKLGVRQCGDDAPPEKLASNTAKCESSTSSKLGLRLSGMLVFEPGTQKYRFTDKYAGRAFDAEALKAGIESFFNDGQKFRYELVDPFLARLRTLHGIFVSAPYKMYSTSLLMMYDGAKDGAKVDVRVIDFARTYDLGPGEKTDDGIVLGLQTLIDILEWVASRNKPK